MRPRCWHLALVQTGMRFIHIRAVGLHTNAFVYLKLVAEQFRVATEGLVASKFNFNSDKEERAGSRPRSPPTFRLLGRRRPTLERVVCHLRQCKARVLLECETIVEYPNVAEERRATLGLRLTRGLSYKASGAVRSLFSDFDPLTKDGDTKLVAAVLEKLGKAEVLRKRQKFDDLFKRSARRHGQDVTDHT